MKILFIGDYTNPGGPNEVNRNLLSHLPSQVSHIHSHKTILKLIESYLKIPFCKIIIFSGLMFRKSQLLWAKFLRKKIIYLMHGSAFLETGERNKLESNILNNANIILCVSHTYSKLIKKLYPQHASKIHVLMNGIDWESLSKIRQETANIQRDTKRIILFGGGRKEKNNLDICKAINELNEESHYNLHVDVYGYYRETDNSQDISNIPNVTFNKVIPHKQVNIELAKSILFIQNSKIESFSLAAIDALGVGCSLLISKNVGARDIISAATEMDIIQNPHDIDEIKNKIKWVLEHPNNIRLLESIDKTKTSLEMAATNLIKFCELV